MFIFHSSVCSLIFPLTERFIQIVDNFHSNSLRLGGRGQPKKLSALTARINKFVRLSPTYVAYISVTYVPFIGNPSAHCHPSTWREKLCNQFDRFRVVIVNDTSFGRWGIQ